MLHSFGPLPHPVLMLSLEGVGAGRLMEALETAAELGFSGVEILATGDPPHFHAPAIPLIDRATWAEKGRRFRTLVVQAPNQGTFDISLVSPSPAIRRASLSELWAVCRLAGAIGARLVLVRTGLSPSGVVSSEQAPLLVECLKALDRTAREQGVRIVLMNYDLFHSLQAFHALEHLGLGYMGVGLDLAWARDSGNTLDDVTRFLAVSKLPVEYVRVLNTNPERTALAAGLRNAGFCGALVIASAPSSTAEQQSALRWWRKALASERDPGERTE